MKTQATAMQGQLDEMRAEQRPWVYADIVPNGVVYKNQSGGFSFPIGFILHNTGRLPAQLVSPEFEAHVSRYFFGAIGGIANAQHIFCDSVRSHRRKDQDVGVTIFPNQPRPIGVVAGIPKEDWDWGSLGDGLGAGVAVYGWITYEFPTDVVRTTGFAFYLERTKPDAPGVYVLPSDPTTVPANELHISPWLQGGVWRAD